ncbi:MAG: HAMP domain-containing histidine kinase [Bacteroidaceae bacterium]|nr:HAMP domain-containing histidine kinase [Bacteroidaceae bacterium]
MAILRKILTFTLMLGIGIHSYGQNNPYGINDECYRLYLNSNQHRDSRIGIIYADSMIELGRQIGDNKAVCVGHSALLNCKLSSGTIQEISEEAATVRRIAEETGYTQYLYFAYTQEIVALLEHGFRNKALALAEESYKTAQNTSNHYGIFSSYKTIANIHDARGDVEDSRKYSRMAIDYFWAHKDLAESQSISSTFTGLAETYLTEKSDSCRIYLASAIENAKSQEDSIKAYATLARRCAIEKDLDGFNRYYSILDRYKYLERNLIPAKVLIIYSQLFSGNLDEAERIANTIPDGEDRYRSLLRVAMERQDLNRCLAYTDSIQDLLLSNKHREAENELAEYTAKYNNDRIRLMEQQKRSHLIAVIAFLFLFIIIGACGATYFFVNERRKHEKRVAQLKDVFVQNMSHDIRTPLNSVMGFAQLLSMPGEQWSEEERNEFGSIIMSNGKILTMLIDDILNMSDVETGNYNINIQPENISEVCKTVLKTVQYRVPVGVSLNYENELPEDYTLNTDNGRLQQILINFLTNACKHTDKGSITLSCSLTENPGFLSFIVTDTGSGVPAGQEKAIFERFTKLNAMKPGTGLGLSICKTLSEKMHGRVYLDTKYTGGARFVFAHSLLLDCTPLFLPDLKRK